MTTSFLDSNIHHKYISRKEVCMGIEKKECYLCHRECVLVNGLYPDGWALIGRPDVAIDGWRTLVLVCPECFEIQLPPSSRIGAVNKS
jgi:hypothetical protein